MSIHCLLRFIDSMKLAVIDSMILQFSKPLCQLDNGVFSWKSVRESLGFILRTLYCLKWAFYRDANSSMATLGERTSLVQSETVYIIMNMLNIKHFYILFTIKKNRKPTSMKYFAFLFKFHLHYTL